MDTGYQTAAAAQIPGRSLGSANVPAPSRTFSGISMAKHRIVGLRSTAQEMLDRVAPSPREVCSATDNGANAIIALSYSVQLQQLQDEIAALSEVLDSLSTHI